MKSTKHNYLIYIIFTILYLFSCQKPAAEYYYVENDQYHSLTLDSDSTFSLEDGVNNYTGSWKGSLADGDTISIMCHMNRGTVITTTPMAYFRIKGDQVVRIDIPKLSGGI